MQLFTTIVYHKLKASVIVFISWIRFSNWNRLNFYILLILGIYVFPVQRRCQGYFGVNDANSTIYIEPSICGGLSLYAWVKKSCCDQLVCSIIHGTSTAVFFLKTIHSPVTVSLSHWCSLQHKPGPEMYFFPFLILQYCTFLTLA